MSAHTLSESNFSHTINAPIERIDIPPLSRSPGRDFDRLAANRFGGLTILLHPVDVSMIRDGRVHDRGPIFSRLPGRA